MSLVTNDTHFSIQRIVLESGNLVDESVPPLCNCSIHSQSRTVSRIVCKFFSSFRNLLRKFFLYLRRVTKISFLNMFQKFFLFLGRVTENIWFSEPDAQVFPVSGTCSEIFPVFGTFRNVSGFPEPVLEFFRFSRTCSEIFPVSRTCSEIFPVSGTHSEKISIFQNGTISE